MTFKPEPIYYDGRVAFPRTDFIYSEKIDESVTDGIIDFYHTQEIFEKWAGETIADDGTGLVNTDIKDSLDNPVFVGITDERVRNFTEEVNRVMNNYVEIFPLCSKTSGWKMEEFFNLQYYKPECESVLSIHAYNRAPLERTSHSQLEFLKVTIKIDQLTSSRGLCLLAHHDLHIRLVHHQKFDHCRAHFFESTSKQLNKFFEWQNSSLFEFAFRFLL